MCGVLGFGSVSRRPPARPPARPPSTHNLLTHNLSTRNLLTHNLSTHNLHTTCSHTTCPHTTCSLLTHNLSTHNLLTHDLSTHNLLTHAHTQLVHTQLAHTQLVLTQLALSHLAHTQLTHTQLAHTQLVLTQLAPCSHTTCPHTTYNLLTHNLSTHNLSSHNLPSHILLTHNLLTHNLLTHNLSSHNLLLAHTQLVLTQLTTCSHTTCPHTTCSHTTCSHTTYSHTTCSHTTCPHTTCHPTTWQAWHLVTYTFTLRGRRGTYGTGRALVAQRVPVGAAASRVAGVALGDIHLRFAWQAWHFVTSTFTLRGRRGTYAGNSRLMLYRGRARCGGLAGPPPFATDPWKRYLQYLLLLLQMIGVASSSGWWFSVKSTRGNDSPGCKFKAISFVLNSNEAVPLGLRQAVTLFLILNFGCLEPDVDWLNRHFWRWYPYFSCSNPHVFFVESHIVLLNPIFRTATSQNG